MYYANISRFLFSRLEVITAKIALPRVKNFTRKLNFANFNFAVRPHPRKPRKFVDRENFPSYGRSLPHWDQQVYLCLHAHTDVWWVANRPLSGSNYGVGHLPCVHLVQEKVPGRASTASWALCVCVCPHPSRLGRMLVSFPFLLSQSCPVLVSSGWWSPFGPGRRTWWRPRMLGRAFRYLTWEVH